MIGISLFASAVQAKVEEDPSEWYRCRVCAAGVLRLLRNVRSLKVP